MNLQEVGDARSWNRAVSGSLHGDLLQSWEWGEFKRRTGGWTPKRLAVLDAGGTPVAGAQVLVREKFGMRLWYAPRGPWWNGEGGLEEFASGIKRLGGLRSPVLRSDPPVESDESLRKVGFRLAPKQIQPRATFVVDLTRNEDAILAAFDSRVRYNARLAERKGVEVSVSGTEGVEAFSGILSSTAERKGFSGRNVQYFTALMEVFGEDARVFLAHHDGEAVVGAVVVVFEDTAYYLYGASDGNRKVKSSELVQYRAMLWAKSRGATRYDMWGIPANPTEENPLYGVYKFKSGFGGERKV